MRGAGEAETGSRSRNARIDDVLAKRAAQALLQHFHKWQRTKALQRQTKSLLGDEWQHIFAQITLSKIPERTGPKPVPIALVHPIYSSSEDFCCCLIVKEEDKNKVKRALETSGVKDVPEVVGLQELRTDYHAYIERRKLRDAFDMFLVDDRILPMLSRALGKIFFSKKKQPIPLKISQFLGKGDPTTVLRRIEAARQKTYLYRNHGNCISLRIARTDFTPEQVTANLLKAIEEAIAVLPGKWKNVQNISIKTSSSVALPVYTRLPQYLLSKPLEQRGTQSAEEIRVLRAEEGEGKPAALKNNGNSVAGSKDGRVRMAGMDDYETADMVNLNGPDMASKGGRSVKDIRGNATRELQGSGKGRMAALGKRARSEGGGKVVKRDREGKIRKTAQTGDASAGTKKVAAAATRVLKVRESELSEKKVMGADRALDLNAKSGTKIEPKIAGHLKPRQRVKANHRSG